jgi:hypothetical protein
MIIEIYTDLQSEKFEIKNKKLETFLKQHLEEGRDFEIFFPDYEI